MRLRLLGGLLLAVAGQSAQFFTGQAARAVLGQSSFGLHDAGVTGTALTVSKSKLYVADISGKLLTFDLAQIPAPDAEFSKPGIACKLCGFAPVSSITQSVTPGTATVSVWGKSLAAIDMHSHRVLLWRDVTSPAAFIKPDVVLSTGQTGLLEPISVAVDGQRLFVGDGALHAVLVWNALPEMDNQPADAILGGDEPETPFGAATIKRPEALVSDGTNLFVSDAASHRILLFSPADARLQAEAVINSATLQPGAFAGGTLISISGSSLAETTAAASEDGAEPLPRELGGVQVICNGTPLPLSSVSPSEVRAQLPYTPADLTAANLYIRTERPGGGIGITNAVAINLTPASPGLFAFGGDEPRPGIAFHQEAPISQDQPASPGETIKLWATGLHVLGESKPTAGLPFAARSVSVSPVTALVDGEPAEVVQVSLPPTSIGIYEILVRLPSQRYSGGLARLTLAEDGENSNTVLVSVTQ